MASWPSSSDGFVVEPSPFFRSGPPRFLFGGGRCRRALRSCRRNRFCWRFFSPVPPPLRSLLRRSRAEAISGSFCFRLPTADYRHPEADPDDFRGRFSSWVRSDAAIAVRPVCPADRSAPCHLGRAWRGRDRLTIPVTRHRVSAYRLTSSGSDRDFLRIPASRRARSRFVIDLVSRLRGLRVSLVVSRRLALFVAFGFFLHGIG